MSVHVYTEWGKLKEVIVGNCINFNIDNFDDIFRYLYELKKTKITKPKLYATYVKERQEDLDNFAKILESFGVKVKRPDPLTKVKVLKTPFFTSMMNAVGSPRDMFFCIGNEIIETPPVDRNRYHESMLLYDVFLDYFKKGARWSAAPRPRLGSKNSHFIDWRKFKPSFEMSDKNNDYDIGFDAANCLKFGKDILMNIGNINHELGYFWLKTHLKDKFRIHPVTICNTHIDGMMMPIRKGVLLINPLLKSKIHLLPEALQKWKMIPTVSLKKCFNYPIGHVQLASFEGMNTNVFSIDENTVCVRDQAPIVGERLEKEGFKVISVQIRHSELFGGGPHCVTLDINREDSLDECF